MKQKVRSTSSAIKGNPQYGKRIEKAKKGKGSFTRTDKHKTKQSY